MRQFTLNITVDIPDNWQDYPSADMPEEILHKALVSLANAYKWDMVIAPVIDDCDTCADTLNELATAIRKALPTLEWACSKSEIKHGLYMDVVRALANVKA